jgi:hypothetical protein
MNVIEDEIFEYRRRKHVKNIWFTITVRQTGEYLNFSCDDTSILSIIEDNVKFCDQKYLMILYT